MSCDWGTTSFRLRLASLGTGEVLHELRAPAGIKAINESLSKGLADEGLAAARANAFEVFLRGKVAQMAEATGLESAPLPIVLSGMASSTVG